MDQSCYTPCTPRHKHTHVRTSDTYRIYRYYVCKDKRPGCTCRADCTDWTLRTRWSSRTCRAGCTGCTSRTLRTRRTLRTCRAARTLKSIVHCLRDVDLHPGRSIIAYLLEDCILHVLGAVGINVTFNGSKIS